MPPSSYVSYQWNDVGPSPSTAFQEAGQYHRSQDVLGLIKRRKPWRLMSSAEQGNLFPTQRVYINEEFLIDRALLNSYQQLYSTVSEQIRRAYCIFKCHNRMHFWSQLIGPQQDIYAFLFLNLSTFMLAITLYLFACF